MADLIKVLACGESTSAQQSRDEQTYRNFR